MVKLVTLWSLALMHMSLLGCASQQTATPMTPIVPAIVDDKTAKEEYRLQVGDELEIKFFYNSDLNEKVKIREDGKISLQLLNDVQAAGLTPTALSGTIVEQYGTILRQPEATVIVRDTAARKVFVGGEVRKPGTVVYSRPLTALQAVVEAGGFAETAEPSSVILIRTHGAQKPLTAKIDLQKALAHDPQQDIVLLPSDIIFVPKSTIGEIDQFVDQYIRKVIPIPFGFGYGF